MAASNRNPEQTVVSLCDLIAYLKVGGGWCSAVSGLASLRFSWPFLWKYGCYDFKNQEPFQRRKKEMGTVSDSLPRRAPFT